MDSITILSLWSKSSHFSIRVGYAHQPKPNNSENGRSEGDATKVEMALKLKGVEYEYINEDLLNKSALLLQLNPIHKKVPVLVHNGKAIAESMVILEYIDEVWDQSHSILPKDPYERAMARFWVKFIDDKCVVTLWKACWSRGEEQEKVKEEGKEVLKFLENEIKGKKFFGGDRIGVVDHAANFIAYWFPITAEFVGLQLMSDDEFPNLCRWAKEYCSDPLVNEFLPDRDGFIAILEAYVSNQLNRDI